MIDSKFIPRHRTVLVVDDQEINRDALGIILEDDYDVLYACDGEEAMQVIEARLNDLSIVLLDLIMPKLNGFEVLERAKKDEQMRQIPFIVLTAEKNAELKALQMGAADFITKPFDMHEVILARVARIIELSEGRQLINAAEHDRLTGLLTRSFFFEYVEQLYRYRSDKGMDALVLNVEQFHSVNALHGREFGDRVLRMLGSIIQDFLKSQKGIACRAEADRFEIYCQPQEDYQALLHQFQEEINAFSPDVSVHLRMGVNPAGEDVEPVVMFDRAKAACNLVRGNFQNPLMIYDEELRRRELLNQRLLNDLRAAVDEKQFTVYYQPKYDIQCDPPRLSSAEALIRWKHPELGMISPGQFIPLFEGNGLISVVDHYVWECASRQIAAWKKKFQFSLPVSINLSRADFYDKNLVERLDLLIKENQLEYRELKLELTESAYTENAKHVMEVLGKLRDLGFDIEMDDFGSGYSSLNMLSEMPLDVLKMDMKFVRHIESSQTSFRLVKLILDIASNLSLKVVAEGVETKGQLTLLKDSGCDIVQGFYFSKPVPPEQMEELIEKEIGIARKERTI